MKRIEAIKGTMSFPVLLAMHYDAQSKDPLSKNTNQKGSCRFKEIVLYTSKLEEQFKFYSGVLGFSVISKTSTHFELKVGDSVLKFKESKSNSNPFYHYAIKIPSNKYLKAKKWLEEKTELLLDAETGDDLLYFEFWDAHAIYFKDPSGNIGELIARHTLKNDSIGKFDIDDLQCISEIGTPVADPHNFASELKITYGLNTYGSSMFIGDESGLFVAPTIDRLWFPEKKQKALVYPVDIQINEKGKKMFQYKNYPYKIFNQE